MPPVRKAGNASKPALSRRASASMNPLNSRSDLRPNPRLNSRLDPRWLLQAAAAVVAVSLLCAYLTLCGVFYVAQWQLVLHPSRTVARTPAQEGLAFEPVRFGDDRSGQPQLTGWWLPSDLPQDPAVLMLHSENGSMADALPVARALHDAGLHVLLFDYRGYGASGGRHPTERLMRADAENAFNYLTRTRHIAPASIVVYGTHLGASLAVSLAERHPQLPGIILQSADGDTESRVLRDVRSRLVPVSMLFHQRFPLADPLRHLRTPKLLISYTEGPPPEEAQRAADPKITAELPRNAQPGELVAVIRRFLDTYVAHPPSLL